MTRRSAASRPEPRGSAPGAVVPIAPKPAAAQSIAPRPAAAAAAPSLKPAAAWTAPPAAPGSVLPHASAPGLPPVAPAAVAASTVAPADVSPVPPRLLSHGVRKPPRKPSSTVASRAVEVVVANGVTFNGRGYKVCGVRNKRGMLCGRIGTCPFHARSDPAPASSCAGVEADAAVASTEAAATVAGLVGGPSAASAGLLQAAAAAAELPVAPPAKGRFKRTWTKDEHSRFLIALEKHGRGKWKEIASDVGTRSGSQCQSHACKYFKRQAKDKSDRKKHSIHDITEPEAPPAAAGHPQKPSAGDSAALRAEAVALLRQDAQLLMPVAEPPFSEEAPLQSQDSIVEDEVHAGETDGGDVEDVEEDTGEPDVEVVVYLNQSSVPGQRIKLPKSMNCEYFLCSAASKLGVPNQKLTRIFTRSGLEVDTLDAVMDGEALWLSDGADFLFVEPEQAVDTSELGKSSADAAAMPSEQVESDAQEVELLEEDRVRAFVHLNGSAPGADSRCSMLFPASMDREEFLSDAATSFSLACPLTRIFTRSGSEIEHLDEILDGEELWVSPGEDFACGS